MLWPGSELPDTLSPANIERVNDLQLSQLRPNSARVRFVAWKDNFGIRIKVRNKHKKVALLPILNETSVLTEGLSWKFERQLQKCIRNIMDKICMWFVGELIMKCV